MLYKPSRKEMKQIKELNRGYSLIKKGFDIIIKNSPKRDSDIGVYIYRAAKNIELIIKRTAKILEAQFVDTQFKDIIKNFNKKNGK